MAQSLLTAQRLLVVEADFENTLVNEALTHVKSVIQEKLTSGDDVEDDLADFSLVALNAAEASENFEDSVNVRIMLEQIWEQEEAEDDEDDHQQP